MSERDDMIVDEGDESFLSRWARRKAQARRGPTTAEPQTEAVATPAAAPAVAAPAVVESAAPANQAAPAAAEPPPPPPLPDIETLGEDSDYSAFLRPDVDANLRRLALRKLFRSPKFNVFDGLDTYRDDFTSFPALGDIVTADMKYQMERLAKKAAEALTEPTAAPETPAVATAGVAAEAGMPTDAAPTDAGVAADTQTPPPDAPVASPTESTPAAASAASHEDQHDRSSTS